MYQITIKVNGEEIYLTGYPSEIISEVILTMLKTLKAVEEIKNAVIEIKK